MYLSLWWSVTDRFLYCRKTQWRKELQKIVTLCSCIATRDQEDELSGSHICGRHVEHVLIPISLVICLFFILFGLSLLLWSFCWNSISYHTTYIINNLILVHFLELHWLRWRFYKACVGWSLFLVSPSASDGPGLESDFSSIVSMKEIFHLIPNMFGRYFKLMEIRYKGKKWGFYIWTSRKGVMLFI